MKPYNDHRNADLICHDVCDQRPIFANEFDKIYIRRNGYVQTVLPGKDLENLKSDSYLYGPLISIETNKTKSEDEKINKTKSEEEETETEYFSCESGDDTYVSCIL